MESLETSQRLTNHHHQRLKQKHCSESSTTAETISSKSITTNSTSDTNTNTNTNASTSTNTTNTNSQRMPPVTANIDNLTHHHNFQYKAITTNPKLTPLPIPTPTNNIMTTLLPTLLITPITKTTTQERGILHHKQQSNNHLQSPTSNLHHQLAKMVDC